MTRTLLRSGLTPRVIYLVVVLLLVVGGLLTEYVVGMAKQRSTQIRSMEATALLAGMRAQLETEVNSVLYLSRGLITFVSTYPDSSPERWYELSREVLGEAPLVRNIGLAPDNVMRFVYPLEGNEAVIGLDYRAHTEQWPAVEEAIINGKMKLAGPVNLVQGGQGVIAREPILYRQGTKRHYWGLASIVIDFDALMHKAGITETAAGFAIAIRGRDGTGEAGEVFFGDRSGPCRENADLLSWRCLGHCGEARVGCQCLGCLAATDGLGAVGYVGRVDCDDVPLIQSRSPSIPDRSAHR